MSELLGAMGDFPSHELNQRILNDSVPVVLNPDQVQRLDSTSYDIYHGRYKRSSGTKAFACLNCHYLREFPVDAVLHAIPMCERCFGSMSPINYVGE